MQTERDIQRALDNVVSGRTTFAIAHRLSTLEKADLLVVIKDGKLAEIGTQAELLALDGEYAKLHKAQARAARNREEDEDVEPVAPEPEREPLYEPARLELEWDSDARLWASTKEQPERRRVLPRRCFPLTNPEHFVSLVDEQGRERVCIESLSELTTAARTALENALAASEFLPAVERIVHVKTAATRSEWQVETDSRPARIRDRARRSHSPSGRWSSPDHRRARHALPGAGAGAPRRR
ncbi:MAG: DUF1854 domain-containing protein [Polyangiaceae bacterium]